MAKGIPSADEFHFCCGGSVRGSGGGDGSCGRWNVLVVTMLFFFRDMLILTTTTTTKKHSYKTMQQILSITSVKLHENKKIQ